jgi:DNA-3-methyladenine glycosylase II
VGAYLPIMRLSLDVTPPYSFARTVDFVRHFPPCQGDHVVTDDAITAAVSVGGIARAFTVRDGAPLTVELPRHVDLATQRALVARAAHLIGAHDDLAALYAAAQGDPPFAARVRALHGLHHVRFLTLPDVAVYGVLAQRTPIRAAAALKRRFLARFGIPVAVDGGVLRAMPELDQLAELPADAIADAIGHAAKAARIAGVVRGVAPYAAARDALLAIPGVGPFSAAFILLRGLGRMDELPAMPGLDELARTLYGPGYDRAAIERRYGAQIGYWAYYLKAGAGLDPPACGGRGRALDASHAPS